MNIISTRTVRADDANIEYQLHIKNVKNLNLRIHPDGKIYVSANRYIPMKKIDEFVLSNQKFILSALKKLKNTENQNEQPKQYVNGDEFVILGKKLILKVTKAAEDKKEAVFIDDFYVHLMVNNTNDFAKKKKLTDEFFNDLCVSVYSEIMNEIYLSFQKYNIKMPFLRIKDMKSRWGSCIPSKGIITLNKRLLSAPKSCIEYVVLHEFCHFIHQNHSKAFYNFVASLMPDWKTQKKLLDDGKYIRYSNS